MRSGKKGGANAREFYTAEMVMMMSKFLPRLALFLVGQAMLIGLMVGLATVGG